MSAKKRKEAQENDIPENVENVETNENVETQPTTLDELKKRQDELADELREKKAQFKKELDEKKEAQKVEYAAKKAELKEKQDAEKAELKEKRARERAEKAEAKQREGLAEKIAKMNERHKLAMARLENLGDTVETDVAESGLSKNDRVNFTHLKTGETLTGIIKGFFPYGRSFTTAAKLQFIDESGETKMCYRSITKLDKIEVE